MNVDTRGIVIKQVKIQGDRRMITLFSDRYGKISAGSPNFSGGKNKTSLALKPFTLGKYQLYKSREYFQINSAETVKSFYSIGEDIDKYMYCSYILEFTEKLLMEERPMPRIYELLNTFLGMMEKRKKELLFLVIAYELKAIKFSGVMPELSCCIICKQNVQELLFSVRDGGTVCRKCCKEEALIYPISSDIINIIKYIEINSIESLGKLCVDKNTLKFLWELVSKYCEYHLDICNLKSEKFIVL